jgi:hypothetical protein
VTVIIGNRQLAARARDIALDAPPGTLTRRSAGCVAVALATTNTLAAAREALGLVRLDEVRAAAVQLLDHLGRDCGRPGQETN